MPIPITARGAKMLKDELQRLKTQDRPAVVQAIAEAREKGDLSENAEYVETGNRQTVQIVGNDESDTKLGRISVASPMARALIGKSEGDEVEVQAPGGLSEYEIISVQYI